MITKENKLAVQNIVAIAEQAIYKQLGIEVRLEATLQRRAAACAEVAALMGRIAAALHMTMDDYYGGRHRRNADLRCITCYIIKLLHPETTLTQTGDAMGIDHTAVLYHLRRAHAYIQTKEPQFLEKYQTVINSLEHGS